MIIILIISLIIILFLAVLFSHFIYNYNYIFKNKYKKKSDFSLSQLNDDLEVNKTLDFETKTFGIIIRKDCRKCGLFSYYSLHLGCILIYLNQGYIPIIDVSSFRNIFNGYNKSSPQNKINPWEAFFIQPFGYTLDEVLKNAKKIKKLRCKPNNMAPSEIIIYKSQLTLEFFREMSQRYMPIKKEIVDKSNIIWEKLFKGTKNVLGVLGRGTDYVGKRPHGHSIPPSAEKMIKDVKKMDEKN